MSADNPYPELSKAQQLIPKAQIIARFIGWANDNQEPLASSPEELEEQLVRFFGINLEQLEAEQAAADTQRQKVENMIERFVKKHGRAEG